MSQLRIAVLLVDDADACYLLHYTSLKCVYITRSMRVGETYEFLQNQNYEIDLKLILNKLNRSDPLFILKHCESIFYTATASKRLWDSHLINEIADICRTYRENGITDDAWIRSKQNITDSPTRNKRNPILYKETLS